MTPHAQWRLQLARQIAPAFADFPQVAAAIVGGSVGRGIADAHSDLEIGVFWDGPPVDAVRRALAERVGVVDDFGEYAPDPDDLGGEEAGDDLYVGGDRDSGFNVELKHKTVANAERYLDRALLDYEPDDQRLLVVLHHAVPLCGRDLVARWQARLAHYPPELARREIGRHLRPGPWAEWEALAAAGADLRLLDRLGKAGWGLVVALAALNGVYAANAKWITGYIAEMEIVPDDFFARLKAVFRLPPAQKVGHFRRLAEEVMALAGERVPGVDGEALRQAAAAPWPAPDPPAAVRRSLAEVLGYANWGWSNRVEFYAEREDLFFFYNCLSHRLNIMASALFALNGAAAVPGAPLLPQVERLDRAPRDFAGGVRALLRSDLRQAYREAERLIADTLALAESAAPQAVAAARAEWQGHRRRKWDAPPPGLLAEQ